MNQMFIASIKGGDAQYYALMAEIEFSHIRSVVANWPRQGILQLHLEQF